MLESFLVIALCRDWFHMIWEARQGRAEDEPHMFIQSAWICLFKPRGLLSPDAGGPGPHVLSPFKKYDYFCCVGVKAHCKCSAAG